MSGLSKAEVDARIAAAVSAIPNIGPFFTGATHVERQFLAAPSTNDIFAIDLPIPATTSPQQVPQREELYAMQVSFFARVKGGGGAGSHFMASGIARRDSTGTPQAIQSGFTIGGAGTLDLATLGYVISGQNAQWRVDNTSVSEQDVIVVGVISPAFIAEVF